MPIVCITGVPGAGKTLRALSTVLNMVGVKQQANVAEIQAGLASATRPIAFCGVEGLIPGLGIDLVDPMDWQSLPDGCVVLVDEAWKWWGSHLPAGARDQRYMALAEHRHRGFDFVITCQAPAQLQTHVKSLVGEHEHVARKFNTKITVVWKWPDLQSAPNSEASKNRALDEVWTHPKGIYGLYQSATMHTIKRKIPKKLILALCVLPVVAGLLFFGVKAVASIGKHGSVPGLGESSAGEESSAPLDGSKPKGQPLTTEQYLAQFAPRVSTMPMSAPAYDEREIVAEPRMFCVVSGPGLDAQQQYIAGRCRCVTEQNTPWALDEVICRKVVALGGMYDPYKAVEKSTDRVERMQGPAPVAPVVAPSDPVGIGVADPSKVAYGGMRGEVGSAPEPGGL